MLIRHATYEKNIFQPYLIVMLEIFNYFCLTFKYIEKYKFVLLKYS